MSSAAGRAARACRRCHEQFVPTSGEATCERCKLARLLQRLLDDGTGTICPRLQPLYDLLLGSPKPVSARCWLYKPHVAPLLTALATGERELTHQGLHTYPHYRVASHLRAILIRCAVLPEVDKQVLDYERWLEARLAAHAGHPHLRLLQQFGRWHQLARMRAARQPLPPTAFTNACRRFGTAGRFLTWLRENTIAPDTITQADIDTWYLTHNPSQRSTIVAFWNWATSNGHLSKLRLQRMRYSPGSAMTQQSRLDLIRHYLSDVEILLSTRVAVCLMLLYGQQLTRILRLTLDDISRDPNSAVLARFGDPPTPVPEPFAALLLALVNNRDDPGSLTSGTSRWLFPGRIAGEPLSRAVFFNRIRRLGFPIRQARVSALRQLVLDVPAPVVATALGLHQTTTTRQGINAGATWNRYATGEHTRPPRPPVLNRPPRPKTSPEN